ncbi:MAG TPA: cytochrome c peroxidase [Methylocystis sp.]|nr:cytochrome c peroxidase [Methylocystis sp.]
MRRTLVAGGLVALAAVVFTAIARSAPAKTLIEEAKTHFQPLPTPPMGAGAGLRAELGRRLFYENRVSADGNVSCGHCHQADLAATDGLPKAIGVNGKENARNAPSVFNASLNFKQHWRGDRESLEEQAEKSPTGPATFGNPDFATVVVKLKAIPDYADLFAKAFPGESDPINQKNWGLAIADFERTLLTPSRFDAFLKGDAKALTPKEQAGLQKFISAGCVSCHNGPLLGGNSFQKFGVAEDYWKETGSPSPDKGRFDATKNEADLYVFKVPQLRNVEKTAPYFHDGSVAELPKAVKVMGRVQLGQELKDEEVAAIVTFLASLTGPVPANYPPLLHLPDAPK